MCYNNRGGVTMKKITALFLILAVLLMSGCNKRSVPVADSSVENYNITYVGNAMNAEFLTVSSVAELILVSDIIVIASTDTLYCDAEQSWTGFMKTPDDFENTDMWSSYSVRPFKVKKVLKGNPSDRIDIYENIITNGSLMRVNPVTYPITAGEDYILFLNRANGERQMYYHTAMQGAYNLDFEKNIDVKNVNQLLAREVQEYFSEYFK